MHNKIKEVLDTWLAQMKRKLNTEKNPIIKDLYEKQIEDYKKYFDTLTEKK